MSTQLLVFQTLNGLGIGMIYFLLSVGLTLIFGLMRFVNFAHGAFYLVAAYIAYAVTQATGSFWLAMLLAPTIVGALALLIERILLRHTYAMSHVAQIPSRATISAFSEPARKAASLVLPCERARRMPRWSPCSGSTSTRCSWQPSP